MAALGSEIRRSPALIIVGGFAGTGKTTVSRRLSAELGIPSNEVYEEVKRYILTRLKAGVEAD